MVFGCFVYSNIWFITNKTAVNLPCYFNNITSVTMKYISKWTMEKLFRSKTTAQRDAPRERVKDKKIHKKVPAPPCVRGPAVGNLRKHS